MRKHPNADVIRALYATPGGPDAVEHLFHEDALWHLPGQHPMAGDHAGRAAVLAAMRYFEGIQLELMDVLASDVHAIALLHASGTRKGREYRSLEFDVFRMKDGKIAEFWSFSEDQRITDEYWS
jgi:hypothetical protein